MFCLFSCSGTSSAGHIWSSSKRAPSLILMEIYCWSQNRASLTRCIWQSQLLPNRYFDFILINRAALLSIFSAFFGKLRKSNSAIFGLSVEVIIQWLTREDRESLCSCHESGCHSPQLHITLGLHLPSCTAHTHSRPPLHQLHSCHHSLISLDCLPTPAPHSHTHI